MFRLGLTGGIASGKTTVATLFAKAGAGIVDTDIVAREVVATGEPGLDAIKEAFGHKLLLKSGGLNREAMRKLIYTEPTAREKLNSILHPLIRARTLLQVEGIEAPYTIIVVPLLVETNFAKFVNRVLVVDCPRKLQINRLVQRDAISAEEASAILVAQADRKTRITQADDIIDGSKTLNFTRQRVKALHKDYLQRAINDAERN